jgi:hypothetical protein
MVLPQTAVPSSAIRQIEVQAKAAVGNKMVKLITANAKTIKKCLISNTKHPSCGRQWMSGISVD